MDKTLHKAIGNLLSRISDYIVTDLLLIEVDWGDQTPAVTHQVIQITFQGASWPLVYTDSELVLRHTLCHGQAILALPHQNGLKIPRDIRARADQIAPHQLGLRDRLYALTERDWPAEVDYADWRPSIERHLDHLVSQAGGAGLHWNITRNMLEAMLIEAAFGFTQVEGRDAAQLLADLTMTQRRQQSLAGPSISRSTSLEQALLQGQLRANQLAWADVILWATEALGRAEELIQTGLMMAAEQMAGYLPNWGALNTLRANLINERQIPEKEAIEGIIKLSTDALSYLHHATRSRIIKAAEQAILPVLPDDAYNPWFPTVFNREIERTAQRLARRDVKVLDRVSQLANHFSADQRKTSPDVLTEMASLIEQWRQAEKKVDTLDQVPAWAAWYASQGSNIDLTALRLAGHQGTGLDEPVQQLLRKYWTWRNNLNNRFAPQFLDNYEAALHDRTAGIFGVHRILSWGIRPWLQDNRQVLLLIIDGMGCAHFQHLLQEWAQQTPPVYAQPEEKILAALSLAPSVTSVSRKGLFLGSLPTDRLDDEQVYAEKAKTTEAQALARVFPQKATKLYNKSNLGTGHNLLNDLTLRAADLIVAIFNAIDDDLTSTTTNVRLPGLQKDMGPLANIVRTALESGWIVIVTADHGHTWHRGKKYRLGPIAPNGGERFKPLPEGETPPPGAVVTDDPNIVRVQTGARVALLTTTVGAYFGQHPRRGHHGGVSLEEIVVPFTRLSLTEPVAQSKPDKRVDEVTQTQTTYDLSGVVLNLADGRIVSLDLPFTLSQTEVKLLQALARLGEASEADLKQALSTRRIAGPLASLKERLATAGPNYEYVEQTGMGAGGTRHRFRLELLK